MSSRVPKGLPPAGRRLWRAATSAYVLTPTEEEILRTACHTVAEIERLEGLLARSAAIVRGSTGQPRPNPLLAEVRRHREVLVRLVGSLRLPDARDKEAGGDDLPAGVPRLRRRGVPGG